MVPRRIGQETQHPEQANKNQDHKNDSPEWLWNGKLLEKPENQPKHDNGYKKTD